MEVRPQMDIRFPAAQEAELLEVMRSNAASSDLWQLKDTDPFNRPPEEGKFYFHRDANDHEPSCTVCIRRLKEGHLIVHTITPDENGRIPVEQYVKILNDFDSAIAMPSAESLSGMTSIGTSKHTLHDYFSREAIRLLERFCKTSNGYGTHPSDQEKWHDFLLYIYRNGEDVHCDVFGACLKASKMWIEDGIDSLVHEYDFTLNLLKRSELKL